MCVVLQEVSNLKEKHDRGDIDDDQHKVMMREKTKDLTISVRVIKNFKKL
jgi:hypothetical protein